MHSGLAVVEEGGDQVSGLPEGNAVGAVVGLADEFSGVVGSRDGAADLIEVVGLGLAGGVGFI